jgi:hypothetical protein
VKKNGHARPFGFFSRFFTEEDLALCEAVERLREVPHALREVRLAVERGEMLIESLAFESDDDDAVDPPQEKEP